MSEQNLIYFTCLLFLLRVTSLCKSLENRSTDVFLVPTNEPPKLNTLYIVPLSYLVYIYYKRVIRVSDSQTVWELYNLSVAQTKKWL